MKTLYLRNVPDDVVERLERLATRDGTSVSAVAVRELAAVSRRADNPDLLGALPDFNFPAGKIVANLDVARADR
jgi:plasmid stability protein